MTVLKNKPIIIILYTLIFISLSLFFSSINCPKVLSAEAQELSESAKAGKEIFDEVNCLLCHLLNGEGGGLEDAPDFAGVHERRKPDEMKEWLKKHLFEEPRISMFEEDPTDEDIAKLIDYLQTL